MKPSYLSLAALAALSLSPIKSLAQSDFPYVAKAKLVNAVTLGTGAASNYTTNPASPATDAAGNQFSALTVFNRYGDVTLYDKSRLADVEARTLGTSSANYTSIFDADMDYNYLGGYYLRVMASALTTRSLKGKYPTVTVHTTNTSTSSPTKFNMLFSMDQPTVIYTAAGKPTKTWVQLPNKVRQTFQLGYGEIVVTPFRITAGNAYVLRYVSTQNFVATPVSIIAQASVPKWLAKEAVTPTKVLNYSSFEGPLVLTPGEYSFVVRYATSGMAGAFELIEYAPSTAAWTARSGDFPITFAKAYYTGTLMNKAAGTSSYKVVDNALGISSVATSYSLLTASPSSPYHFTALFNPAESTDFKNYITMGVSLFDPALVYGASSTANASITRASVAAKATYTLGIRNLGNVYSGNRYRTLISRDVPTVTYSANGLTKVWTRGGNSVKGAYRSTTRDHLQRFRINADSRYVLRFVGAADTDVLYAIRASDVLNWKRGLTVDGLPFSAVDVESVITNAELPAGDYAFAVQSGTGAYELVEYR